jgi:hypothetical protein
MSDSITFLFEDVTIPARAGQSIGAALIAAGERWLRTDEGGNPKGVVCGIGLYWECRCVVGGVPDTRACMTPAQQGMVVRRQHGLGA